VAVFRVGCGACRTGFICLWYAFLVIDPVKYLQSKITVLPYFTRIDARENFMYTVSVGETCRCFYLTVFY